MNNLKTLEHIEASVIGLKETLPLITIIQIETNQIHIRFGLDPYYSIKGKIGKDAPTLTRGKVRAY